MTGFCIDEWAPALRDQLRAEVKLGLDPIKAAAILVWHYEYELRYMKHKFSGRLPSRVSPGTDLLALVDSLRVKWGGDE